MENRQLKLGVILSYLSMSLKIIISLIYTPIMLRILGQQEYGLYQLVISVISNLSILNIGFGSAYIRFFAQFRAQKTAKELANMNGLFFAILSILAVFTILLGFWLGFQPSLVFGQGLQADELRLAQELLFILVIMLGFSFINLLFNSYIIANEKFSVQRGLDLLQTLASPLLQLPLLLLGLGSRGIVIGTTITSLCIYSYNIYYCYRRLNFRMSWQAIDWSLLKEIGHYSSFIFLAMIIDQINWNVDVYLVGRFYGTVATAVYSIAELMDGYFRQFSSSFSSLLTPRIHTLVSENISDRALTEFFIKMARIQFLIMALIASGFIFFGQAFIYKWAGPEYQDSFYISLVLILPLLVPIIQNGGIEIRRAKNQHQFYTKVSFITALMNVGFTIILLNFLPAIGAAISTSVTLLINSIILNINYHRSMNLDMIYFWREILSLFKGMILPIVMGTIFNVFVDLNDMLLFVLCGIMYVFIYGLSMWFLAMNAYEKSLVKNILGIGD